MASTKAQLKAKRKYRASVKGIKAAKDYYESNKEKHAKRSRSIHLRINFGLTMEDYEKLFTAQNGCCAICGAPQSELKRRLAVDHNHITGQIRGLLCFRCNASIGKFGDDPEMLLKAVSYLKDYDIALTV